MYQSFGSILTILLSDIGFDKKTVFQKSLRHGKRSIYYSSDIKIKFEKKRQ